MSRRHARKHLRAAPASRVPAAVKRPAGPTRVTGIDTLRGGAICLMFIYHFSFDLRYYRVIDADFENDPFWLGFRALIVASFMTLVGVSLVLADRAGATPVHFWKRIGVIGACAIAASVGSYALFPDTFIYFGILHCIAVASILAWPAVGNPRTAVLIGVTIVVAGLAFSHPFFDERTFSWLGFTTHKPPTEDFVPLAPWAGFVFLGITLGYALARVDFRSLAPLTRAPRWLPFLGRHSLVVYMIHQPILLAILWMVAGRVSSGAMQIPL